MARNIRLIGVGNDEGRRTVNDGFVGYDIIGDVHGQAGKLEALLRSMGYRHTAGAWRHDSRQAIFLGDLIDYGRRQLETVNLVRCMVDAGSARAIMGNHEFNAISWYHGWRRQTQGNFKDHEPFLDAVVGNPALYAELIDWMLKLPLWIDDEATNARFVHACWNDEHIATVGSDARLSLDDVRVASIKEKEGESPTPMRAAVECLLKGPEDPNDTFVDHHGKTRHRRLEWWRTYDGSALCFFGHYRQPMETPRISAPRALCLDYSDREGKHPLFAYRFDFGDTVLDENKLVRVPVA